MAQKLIGELHAPAPYGGLVVAERPRNYEPSARLSYRPDIDGLHAIAVIAVIAFHALPNTFRGGFIGVDVFFVILWFSDHRLDSH
jgi:hypothetical protein